MLKVLISTEETQGEQPGDYSWVPDGEMVARYGVVCASERADGTGCGCGRAFGGFRTHRSTTTAMVAEVDMTEEQWRAELYRTLKDTGWADAMEPEGLAALMDEVVELDLHQIAALPVGVVLGRHAYNEAHDIVSDELLVRRVPT